MPGTKEGAIKARATILELYGDNFYKEIGGAGGAKSRGGGFAQGEVGRQRAVLAGKRGGKARKGWRKNATNN